MPTSSIRPATSDDLAALVEMGRAFFVEAGHQGVAGFFDEGSFRNTLGILHGADLLRVAAEGAHVVGMAAADVARAFWNRDVMMGAEVFWYVRPGHRHGVGRELLASLESVAHAHGVKIFDVFAEEGGRSDALSRVYRANSYAPAQRGFRKMLSAEET